MFSTRPAKIGDVPTILSLIKELAQYEKLLDEVKATEETLRHSLFESERKVAEVILAFEGEIAVGYALFFHNFSTFLGVPGIYLEDIYIKPEYRKRGYGKSLLVEVAHLAKERGCGRVEWSVLDWNQPSIDFYKSLGAFPMSDWTGFRLTGSELLNVAALHKR
eukprot:TRINITY_DN7389_c0_g2_i1.p1 TRINITY_DN7389_c0_g2~~TRINITY_DN7389_c0_g2_i1.p1  ORF type:complete len:163 (-),score=26.23 TRINITY_DN7389_c0_g2_i1:91-579(-)